MKIINKTTNIPESMRFTAIDTSYNNGIFIDIETTGFSRKYNFIYLIGCAFIENEHFILRQYLIESESEESQLLLLFKKLIENYNTIVTYNGQAFDLPFLTERGQRYGLNLSFDTIHILDLYIKIKPYKNLLQLSSLKQKSIEMFLQLHRKDQYSGGELIPIYMHYERTHDSDDEALLLLHNYEDVLGMTELLPLLAYCQIDGLTTTISQEIVIEQIPMLNSENKYYAVLQLTLPYPIPIPIHKEINGTFISAEQVNIKYAIPILDGTLKLFYPDYKNYYFLTEESYAIHKSVGVYVDPQYRQPAKASNCYGLIYNRFIPSYGYHGKQNFGINYKLKLDYILLDEWYTIPVHEYIRGLLGF